MKNHLTKYFPLALVSPLLFAAATAFLLTACAPEWIDDDSYIYLVGTGKVMVRDVSRKESKEVTSLKIGGNAGELPRILATNPGKNQFVIAQLNLAEKESFIAFDFYSLDGMKTDTSDPIPIDLESYGGLLNVHWSPDGKTLFAIFMSRDQPTLVYHIEKRTHRFHKMIPFTLRDLGLFTVANAITPDSEAFIAVQPEGESKVSLLSIETGKVLHEFDLSSLPKEVRSWLESNELDILLSPTWKGNTLIQPLQNGELKFDIDQKKVTFQQTDQMQKLLEHAMKDKRRIVGVINKNLIVESEKDGQGDQMSVALELYNFESGKREAMENYAKAMAFRLSKSRDGQKTLISATVNTVKTQATVFDAKGKVIDSFEYNSGLPMQPGK